MKEVKVAITHTTDGNEHRFIPEEEIVDWLQKLKKCPFCKGCNITKSKLFHTTLQLTCNDCDFEVSSKDLLYAVEIKENEEIVKIDWILEDAIKKLTEQYEDQLKKQITSHVIQIRRIEDILILRDKRFFK